METSASSAGSLPSISNHKIVKKATDKDSGNHHNSDYALTKEKLILLNLENGDSNTQNHDLIQYALNNNSYTTTPELSNSSSSSSSLNSDNEPLYKFYNGSGSSIATVVQKLSSTTSTINLIDLDQSNTDGTNGDHEKEDITHEEIIVPNVNINSNNILSTDDDDDADDDEIEDDKSITSNSTTDKSIIPRSLKSSLKLPSLKRSKSLPFPKTVRFSSELERIKTFNEYAKPSSISLENSPDQSPPIYNNLNPSRAYFDLNDDMFFNSRQRPWYEQNSSSSSSDEDDDDDNEGGEEGIYYRSPAKWSYKPLNFSLWRQSDSDNIVKLTSMFIEKDSVVGRIQVSNLSFEKSLEVKFTMDGWKTIYIVNAQYDLSLNSSKDQFKFEINLPNSLMMNSKKKSSKNQATTIELCIKYSSNGVEDYDNNHGSNFRFQVKSNKRQSLSNFSRRNSHLNHHEIGSSFVKNPSYIAHNFASSLLSNSNSSSSSNSPDYTSNKNYTTSRYFSDDTDYFNTKYLSSSNKNQDQKQSSPQKSHVISRPSVESIHGSSSSSTVSSIDSANSSTTVTSNSSNSSNETIKANNSNQEYNDALNAESLNRSRQHYNEFLKKYCFFKSDDLKRDEINGAPFIR